MEKVVFETIKVRRLSETIENHIKDYIFNQKLKPQERLPTEKEISRQFGVSPVTVREALRALETLGLIKKKKGKNGGIFVSEATLDLVKVPLYSCMNANNITTEQISQFRLILEPAIISTAVNQIKVNDLKALEVNIKSCEDVLRQAKNGFSEQQLKEMKEKNIEFHKLIAAAARNPIMTLTLDCVLDFLFTFKKETYALDIEFLSQSIKEHRTIVSNIKAGDAQGAEKALVLHLQKTAQYWKKKEI